LKVLPYIIKRKGYDMEQTTITIPKELKQKILDLLDKQRGDSFSRFVREAIILKLEVYRNGK